MTAKTLKERAQAIFELDKLRYKGTWNYVDMGGVVMTNEMPLKVCDIRAWGGLTGTGGGLALSGKEAQVVFKATGQFIAAAPEMVVLIRDLMAENERLKGALSNIAEVAKRQEQPACQELAEQALTNEVK